MFSAPVYAVFTAPNLEKYHNFFNEILAIMKSFKQYIGDVKLNKFSHYRFKDIYIPYK